MLVVLTTAINVLVSQDIKCNLINVFQNVELMKNTTSLKESVFVNSNLEDMI